MKVFTSPAPSMRAASSKEEGMPSENCFMRNTPKGQPTTGKTTAKMEPQVVSTRWRMDISRSSGMRMTCLGSAMAHTNREKMKPRPQKRFFASA